MYNQNKQSSDSGILINYGRAEEARFFWIDYSGDGKFDAVKLIISEVQISDCPVNKTGSVCRFEKTQI